MSTVKVDLERQLRRQTLWLKDSWMWLFRNEVLRGTDAEGRRLKALDVGCGPGFVMEALGDLFEVRGVDIDSDMVKACRSRGLDVVQADACELPFEDASFDIVYCSFLLLWLRDPTRAVGEMRRVSKKWVICLAEPDYGGRVDFPSELSDLTRLIAEGIESEGGDPFVGRRIRSFFRECGMDARIGIHPGVWDIDRLRSESHDEMYWVEQIPCRETDQPRLEKLRGIWDRALRDETLFQFNPVFYAIAKR